MPKRMGVMEKQARDKVVARKAAEKSKTAKKMKRRAKAIKEAQR